MPDQTRHRQGVLYVDDEIKSCKYFRKRFIESFPVFTAHSAQEGRALLDEHAEEIVIILADVRMPEESGVNLLIDAYNSYPTIKRWLVTAYSDHDATVQAINDGAVERYIAKPWNIDQLANDIDAALRENWRAQSSQRRIQRALQDLNKSFLPDLSLGSSKSLLPDDQFEKSPIDLESVVEEQERAIIVQALNKTQGNVKAASELLQMTPRKLHYRIEKLGIQKFAD